MTANGTSPHVGPRGKIAVLLPNGWLYGTVNRGEFSRAIGGNENHPTFRLSKRGWRLGSASVVIVVGSHVAAWEWQVPTPSKRKARKPEPTTPAEISDEDREALAAHMAGVA